MILRIAESKFPDPLLMSLEVISSEPISKILMPESVLSTPKRIKAKDVEEMEEKLEGIL